MGSSLPKWMCLKILSLRFGKSKWLDQLYTNQGQNSKKNYFTLNLQSIISEVEVYEKKLNQVLPNSFPKMHLKKSFG